MESSNHRPLDVVFVWHFHQPYYGVPGGSEFTLPWVRLHSVKSYYDMGRLLERRPQIRATFNFSGSLLRQLREYVDHGRRDRWWRWSRTDPDDLDLAERRGMVRHFFSLDVDCGIEPLPRYHQLYRARQNEGIAACAESWSRQDFLDLQVLFNLAWCGFSARRDHPLIGALRKKGRGFDVDERNALLDIHLRLTARILPLYRELADRNQIEVSVSPMYHPIVPLVIDTDTANRPSPDRPRPPRYRAPDDARTQIDQGLEVAKATLGRRPAGMWPSEGSVSPEALACFADAGVDWIATDEDVLRHSRGDQWCRDADLWKPWTMGDGGPHIFFRDHELSDRIGFVYADNPPDEAADDLVDHLRSLGQSLGDEPGCVSIILDGENPWEHYEDDGRPFLEALYDRLEASDELRTCVPSEIAVSPGRLDHLHSGSWIMANYQIWIGHDETNRAWNWVRRAHEFIERTAERAVDPPPGLDAAKEHLLIAQGSDWFWWYGDDFSSTQDDEFDALFRCLIAGVWTALDETPPAELNRPIHHATDTGDVGGAQISPPRRFISPAIDGHLGRFFDWVGAGQLVVSGAQGSMYETFRPLRAILYGFSPLHLFLRLEPGDDFSSRCHFEIHVRRGNHTYCAQLRRGEQPADIAGVQGSQAAFYDVAELSFPLHKLNLSPGDEFDFAVSVMRDDLQVQRYPSTDAMTIEVPHIDPGLEHWMV